jgi:hypothetical protein
VTSDAVSRTPVVITVATFVGLALAVAGLHSDGHLSTRAAWGALSGLAVALAVLAVSAVVVTRVHGGPTSE